MTVTRTPSGGRLSANAPRVSDDELPITRRPVAVVPEPADTPPGFVWEEPPSSRRRGPIPLAEQLAPHLAKLRAEPGRWARLRDYEKQTSATGAAATLRKQLRGRGFEFAGARLVASPGSRLWGRYVGKGPSS